MNIRCLLLLSVFFIAPRLLPAQEVPVQEAPAPAAPFPLSLALEAVYGDAAGRWRPDWPLDIPPDAFTVTGVYSRISVDLEGLSYTLAYDAQGRPIEFPLVLPASADAAVTGDAAPGEGAVAAGPILAQASVRYHAEGGIAGLSLRLPSSLTWTAQFPLSYIPGQGRPPATGDEAVKVECASQIFYVLFSEGAAELAETWFDPWGEFAAFFSTRIEGAQGAAVAAGGSPWTVPWRIVSQTGTSVRRDYRYESGGNLSQYTGEEGQFSVFYSARQQPLSLTRTLPSETRIYRFQWDEQGLLTRLRDLSPETGGMGGIVITSPAEGLEAAPAALPPVDFRYEYEFDAQGNWILRREIALVSLDGLLLPVYAREITRQITQGD
jgi:hypothetical protein